MQSLCYCQSFCVGNTHGIEWLLKHVNFFFLCFEWFGFDGFSCSSTQIFHSKSIPKCSATIFNVNAKDQHKSIKKKPSPNSQNFHKKHSQDNVYGPQNYCGKFMLCQSLPFSLFLVSLYETFFKLMFQVISCTFRLVFLNLQCSSSKRCIQHFKNKFLDYLSLIFQVESNNVLHFCSEVLYFISDTIKRLMLLIPWYCKFLSLVFFFSKEIETEYSRKRFEIF